MFPVCTDRGVAVCLFDDQAYQGVVEKREKTEQVVGTLVQCSLCMGLQQDVPVLTPLLLFIICTPTNSDDVYVYESVTLVMNIIVYVYTCAYTVLQGKRANFSDL